MKTGGSDSLELSLGACLEGDGDRGFSALKSRSREGGKGPEISGKL